MDEVNTETAGGTRFASGKPGMWWAVPLYGLRLVAKVTEYGGDKYAPLDWREGQSFSTLTDCFFRHTLDMLHHGPLSRDEESGLLNAAHAAWNLLAMLTFIATGRADDLDDVTPWQGVTTEHLRAARDLYADGHPGEIQDIAVALAEGYEEEAIQLDLDDDQSGIVWNPPAEGSVDSEPLTAQDVSELGREVMADSYPRSAVAPIYEASVLDSLDEAFKDAIRERNERMKALLEATVSGARMSDLSPREQLKADLEIIGYHVEPGEVGSEVRITGSSMNPDPTWEETGKLVSKALIDLSGLVGREYSPARVGQDRIRALI